MNMNVEGKRVLVCGMARSGIAAAKLLLSLGAQVTITDTKQEADFGGAVVAAAMLLRQPLILVLIAFWMLMSSLSDIIQITYFKKTHGKRIFKMAPIHHHFELCGIHETKIVTMYMVTTAILCVITLLGVL